MVGSVTAGSISAVSSKIATKRSVPAPESSGARATPADRSATVPVVILVGSRDAVASSASAMIEDPAAPLGAAGFPRNYSYWEAYYYLAVRIRHIVIMIDFLTKNGIITAQ